MFSAEQLEVLAKPTRRKMYQTLLLRKFFYGASRDPCA